MNHLSLMRTKPRLIRIKLKLKIHYKFNFSLIDNNFINYNSPKLIGICHNPTPRCKDVLALAYAWRMHFLLITIPRNAAPKAVCIQLAFNRLRMNVIIVLLLFFLRSKEGRQFLTLAFHTTFKIPGAFKKRLL